MEGNFNGYVFLRQILKVHGWVVAFLLGQMFVACWSDRCGEALWLAGVAIAVLLSRQIMGEWIQWDVTALPNVKGNWPAARNH